MSKERGERRRPKNKYGVCIIESADIRWAAVWEEDAGD